MRLLVMWPVLIVLKSTSQPTRVAFIYYVPNRVINRYNGIDGERREKRHVSLWIVVVAVPKGYALPQKERDGGPEVYLYRPEPPVISKLTAVLNLKCSHDRDGSPI